MGEIKPGDALSLATRFARSWAYRGGQALFWNARFEAGAIVDLYLPAPRALVPRRGFLLAAGTLDGSACAIAATDFHPARERFVPELRFARGQLRACTNQTLLFARIPDARAGVRDLGFREVATGDEPVVWCRGMAAQNIAAFAITI